MDNLLQGLIELIYGIWRTDSNLRDDSVLGESKIERKDRKAIAWVCGGAIVLVVVAGIGCWWWFKTDDEILGVHRRACYFRRLLQPFPA